MINKLLSLLCNENPSYKGKRKTQSFHKEQRAHCKCTFLNQAKQTVYMQMHMHVFVFEFLSIDAKNKVDVKIWISFQATNINKLFFEIKNRDDYDTLRFWNEYLFLTLENYKFRPKAIVTG